MSERSLVLAEIGNSDPPVYIVLDELGDSDGDLEYLIDEHRCPSDTLQCVAVIEGDEDDPHGVVSFIQRVPRPVDWKDGQGLSYAQIRALFDKLPTPSSASGEE